MLVGCNKTWRPPKRHRDPPWLLLTSNSAHQCACVPFVVRPRHAVDCCACVWLRRPAEDAEVSVVMSTPVSAAYWASTVRHPLAQPTTVRRGGATVSTSRVDDVLDRALRFVDGEIRRGFGAYTLSQR